MEQKLIHQKMIAIMKGVTHIGKDKTNSQQGFQYRGIDDMYNELHKLFADNGVIILPEVLDIKREERTSKNGGLLLWTIQTIRFAFMAEDGSMVHAILNGEAMDSADKGSNKANSVALKYALMQMFLIPTKELAASDPDANTPEPKSRLEEQIEMALAMIPDCQTVADLSALKKDLPQAFNDSKVKAASKERYNALQNKAA